jgi:O-antigen/teichoic acid export membrane protein
VIRIPLVQRCQDGQSAVLKVLPSSIRGIFWNLLAGVWTGALVLVSTPVLVAGFGIDRFGVVGLWGSLQVVLGLFDFGLSSTLGRELARSGSDQAAHLHAADVLATFERCAWGVPVVLLLANVAARMLSGHAWLSSSVIPPAEMAFCLDIMVLALAVQFPSILYAGGLVGAQRHGRLNSIQSVVNGLRWGGGALFALTGAPLHQFFLFQVLVSAGQSLSLRVMLQRCLIPSVAGRFRVSILQQNLRFSAGMAGTSICAALIGNADRLLISQFMTSAELGRYAIAFAGCNMIQMITLPFYRVFFPRYSALVAAGDPAALRREYLSSCRWLSLVAVPMAVFLWVFAPELIGIWLGSAHPEAAAILRWLVPGVGAAALGWLPGAFQQANGMVRLHFSMLLMALMLGLPLAAWGVRSIGVLGATAIWLAHGLVSISIEPFLMHRSLLRGELRRWFAIALLLPLGASIAIAIPARVWMPTGMGRWTLLAWLMAAGAAALAASFQAQAAVTLRTLE